MDKPIDHNVASGVATVGLEAGKGALWGAALPGLVAGALVGGFALFLSAPVALAMSLGLLGAGVTTAVALPYMGAIAAVGSGLGALGGVTKVGREKAIYQAQDIGNSQLASAQLQQAYVAGAQAAQADMVQQIQEAQQQRGAFAQRELDRRAAAVAQAQQIG